jgi:cytosine/adenosine deaminase-related metal-dependent hydrolase
MAQVSEFTLLNGVIASGDAAPAKNPLSVSGKKIAAKNAPLTIDLKECSFVYPGLINTHDHLQGNYRPAVGPKPGNYYLTWLPWDNDLKASETFKERSNLSREDLYALSGYKCLFSGVTTVNDHFPQKFNAKILPTLPIRAILEYGISHEVCSYDLKWGEGDKAEHDKAVKNNWPFITHLAEGFDEEMMNRVEYLEKLGILDSHDLFIHCIALSDADIKKIAKAKASVSWCGFSNMFMFNVTCKIRKIIAAGINTTIGTDSSATGSANILEEMRYDRKLYQKLYGEDLSAKTFFKMCTANAAKAFWLDKETGTLDAGKLGDILVVKAKNKDAYENLHEAKMEDIELLCLAGNPIYGELRFLDILGGRIPEGYTQIKVGKRPMFVKGDPAGLYASCREKIGFKKVLDFLPLE